MTQFSSLQVFFIFVFAIFLAPYTSWAVQSNPDRVQFNQDIRIASNERVGDVTCIVCSVHVRGQVAGDVTVIGGSVFLEQGALITGDVTVVGGNARAENGTQVAGDLTVIGGTLLRDPQASVAGDVTTLGGGGWVFLIFLLPFAILGGIIALIVWLNQRSHRPAPVPAYTLRRN